MRSGSCRTTSITAALLLMQRYAAETGRQPHVFQGSSSGAVAFGSLRLRRKDTAAAVMDGTL